VRRRGKTSSEIAVILDVAERRTQAPAGAITQGLIAI